MEITVGDLVELCKENNLDINKTILTFSEDDIATIFTVAKVNKDIIELR